MRQILANYHTHTKRCNHACGEEWEYIENAIQLGMKDFGFADHTPWYYEGNHVSTIRMHQDQLNDYVTVLTKLKKKYASQINIHIGLEAEYVESKMAWLVDFASNAGVEYLILGNHFYPSDDPGLVEYDYFGNCDIKGIQCYIETLDKALQTGYFAYLAHPELIMRRYPQVDEHVINAFERITDLALKYDIPLEYNLSGYAFSQRVGKEMYPNGKFWQIAGKKGCKAIIGFDAHDPQFILDMAPIYLNAQHQLSELGCQLVYTIKHTLKK